MKSPGRWLPSSHSPSLHYPLIYYFNFWALTVEFYIDTLNDFLFILLTHLPCSLKIKGLDLTRLLAYKWRKWRGHRQRYGTGGLPCQSLSKTLKPTREGWVVQQSKKWGKTFPSSQTKWQHISPVCHKEADEEYFRPDKEIVKWLAWEMGANWSKVPKFSAVPSTF